MIENEEKFEFYKSRFRSKSKFKFTQPIFLKLFTKLSKFYSPSNLIRAKINFYPKGEKLIIHSPHIDYDFEHKTGLFYINTADGNTTIFNEKFDRSLASNSFDQFNLIQDNLTIKKIITPRENTVAIFDGLHYHQSSTTTTVPRRIVINFNYTVNG